MVDRSEQVRRDAEAILMLAERVPMLAFVNNHYVGYAPKTVEQLRQELARGRASGRD